LQALSAGALDATLVSPPLDLTAKKQGLSLLLNVAELGIPYPQLVIETSDRFNRENPKIVKSFLKGFIEGVHYVATHKEETKKIITKYLKSDDPEIRNAIDEVAQRVPAANGKKPEHFVDLRFLNELQRDNFFKQFEN
jgi:ABC-type nitrate/sulfonate/bicarbonate transport system substrate-binding protein